MLTTKSLSLLIGAIVILAIAGGAYFIITPQRGDAPDPEPMTEDRADADTAPATSGTASVQVPASTDSFDDFSGAVDADIAAQKSAVSSTDQSASAAASSANTVTTSGQPYDPSTF